MVLQPSIIKQAEDIIPEDKSYLQKICKVAKTGDDFVGIKIDYGNKIEVQFPMGFDLTGEDKELRKDIQKLIQTFSIFTKQQLDGKELDQITDISELDFPINSYLLVIENYLNYGYYVESDPIYKTSSRGKIDWPKTIRKQTPLIQKSKSGNFSFIFTEFTIRSSMPDHNKIITIINRYCVFKAFEKFGWIYGSFMPNKSEFNPSKNLCRSVLNSKISSTFDDKKKKLFTAMLEIIEEEGHKSPTKKFRYGTEKFHVVWEKMIDVAFGITENKKNKFYPSAIWRLKGKKQEESSRLKPDTIMIIDEEYFVIDSKYYQYGVSDNPRKLPQSSDISKQIVYAEILEVKHSVPSDNIFNAFIMPFNMKNNNFQIDNFCGYIGEAFGQWRSNEKTYEQIKGIVFDTKHLMYTYWQKSAEDQKLLVTCIKQSSIVRGQVQ